MSNRQHRRHDPPETGAGFGDWRSHGARCPRPNLAAYSSGGFCHGRPVVVFALWILVDALFVSSWLPGSIHRRWILRAFGASVGRGVIIKPRVRIKLPWRLVVGDNAWIGEGVWIDNLDIVTIGADACLSQGAYLCTGNHDWSRPAFDLRVRPIVISAGAWVAAKSVVGPGVTVGEGAVLVLGGVAMADLAPWSVNKGNPAGRIGTREGR